MTFEVTPEVEVGTDGWVDVTELVFTPDGKESITITHGNQGMLQGLGEPSSCSLTFNDADMWADNPNSPHYGLLGLNTLLRVADVIFAHIFPGTVVDDWADVAGFAITNTGAGGSVLASDFQQTPGVGTHSVPAASAHRKSVLVDFDQEDGEQAISFRLPTADVTGGAIEPANLICQWDPASSEYVMLRLVVGTDESITMKFMAQGGDLDLTSTFTATNVTNTGQWIRVKINVESRRLQAKAWSEDTDSEPLDWTVDATTDAGSLNLSRRGGIGVRTGVASGNTNTKPIVVEYRRWTARAVLFHGGFSDDQLEPVEGSDGEVMIPIVANGPSRQYAQGQLPVVSALRRTLPTLAGLVAYWPMEDEADSARFASGKPNHPPMEVLHGTPGYAEFSELDCSLPLPTGNLADWVGLVPAYTSTGIIAVRFILRCPSSPLSDLSILLRVYTEYPTARFWQLVYRTSNGGSLEIQIANSETETVYVSATGIDALDGIARWISFELANNGTAVDWDLKEFPMGSGAGSFDSGSAAGRQVSSVKRVWVNTSLRDDVVFGHLTIQDEVTDFFTDLLLVSLAFIGDRERARLARVYADNGIAFTAEDESAGFFHEYRMGPQGTDNMTSLLEQAVDLNSGGVLYDARTHDGMMWTDRYMRYRATPHLELTYAQLTGPFRAVRDDRDIRNRITVKRDGGSSGTYELTTGPKSVLPPRQGGAGVYPSEVTVNKETDDDLQQIAAWRVAIGTVNDPRYSSMVIECGTDPVIDAPVIRRRLRDLRPGHLVTLSDAEQAHIYDTVWQHVAGYKVEITQFRLKYDINTVPQYPFWVFEIEDADRGRIDARSSTLENAIDASQTTFTVQTNSDILWIDTATHPTKFPFDVVIGGERMTVTGITTTTPAFVAAGTAAHADNASVTPGLPAGATTGDVLLILAGVNKADFTAGPTAPTDYETLLNLGETKLFGKVHDGSESDPTVGISGGAAGVPLSAQMCALRNVPMLVRASAQLFNGASQNIYVPSLNYRMSKSIAISLGWKADDWTSVATLLPGWTEIGEPSTTLGNDQGLVWDYKDLTGSGNWLPENNFVVTGGASANNRGCVVAFGNHQTFTVTRGANGVTKAHAAGAPVHIYHSPRFAP